MLAKLKRSIDIEAIRPKLAPVDSLQVGDWLILHCSLYYVVRRSNRVAHLQPAKGIPGAYTRVDREELVDWGAKLLGHSEQRWWWNYLPKRLRDIIHPYSQPKPQIT